MEITTTNQLKESGLSKICQKCKTEKLLVCFKKPSRHSKMLERVNVCKGCDRAVYKARIKPEMTLKTDIKLKLKTMKKICLQCLKLKALDKFEKKVMGNSELDRNYVCTICTKANQKAKYSKGQQQRAAAVLARGRDRASLYIKEYVKCL